MTPAPPDRRESAGVPGWLAAMATAGWLAVCLAVAAVIGAIDGYAACPKQQGTFSLDGTECTGEHITDALGLAVRVFLASTLVIGTVAAITMALRRRRRQ